MQPLVNSEGIYQSLLKLHCDLLTLCRLAPINHNPIWIMLCLGATLLIWGLTPSSARIQHCSMALMLVITVVDEIPEWCVAVSAHLSKS